jgi:ubiquinone/menaquinone biosynthesis C-methylase UbiE
MNNYEQLKMKQVSVHNESFEKAVKNDKSFTYLDLKNSSAWSRNYPLYKLESFFRHIAPSEIVTIGDGKGGHEGQIIKKFGNNTIATDISTEILEMAKERNLIDDFAKEDAENLSFEDNSFDYCFIKESLHHLPRPYMCIYEMLRVAKKGIILIEPNGDHCYKIGNEQYESSGNYKYQFTLKELVQCAACLGFNHVAYGYSPNVNYILNCLCFSQEFPEQWMSKETRPQPMELAGKLMPCSIKYGDKFMEALPSFQNAVTKWYNEHEPHINPLLIFMVFKNKIDNELKNTLESCGLQVPTIKPNPYL